MINEDRIVFVVDDDASVRRSLNMLLNSAGYNTSLFGSGTELLAHEQYSGPGCIILDIFLKEASGLDLKDEITMKFPNLPIIFLTGHGDIPMSVKALKMGAVNFLQKPVDDQLLFEAISEAMNKSESIIQEAETQKEISALFSKLTKREFEVLEMTVKGKLNKQIADNLMITEHTVKLHRGKVTRKLGVHSVIALARMFEIFSSRH